MTERIRTQHNADGGDGKLLLRGGEVALALGISRALAYQWMAAGILPVVRVPGARSVRVPRAALLRWIADRTEEARS